MIRATKTHLIEIRGDDLPLQLLNRLQGTIIYNNWYLSSIYWVRRMSEDGSYFYYGLTLKYELIPRGEMGFKKADIRDRLEALKLGFMSWQ